MSDDGSRRDGTDQDQDRARPSPASLDRHGDLRNGTDMDVGRRAVSAWLWRVPVILALGGGAFGVYEAIRVHFDKQRPDATPEFVPVTATEVAPLDAFAEEWDGVAFELPAPSGRAPANDTATEPGEVGSRATVPALAVRLPEPIQGGLELAASKNTEAVFLAAFSRICTHQGCIVELNTDLAAIDFGFNYATDHPALTCPCHLSVFDPGRAGRAVSGPAVRPLARVELRADGGRLWAVGLERG